MKKFYYVWIFLLVLFTPFIVKAFEYEDIIARVQGLENNNKVTLYLFHGDGCPHCAEEKKFLEAIEKEYSGRIEIVQYEVWYDNDNALLLSKVKEELDADARGVPFTVIGNKYFLGYNSSIGEDIKNTLDYYLENTEFNDEKTIPLLGKINVKNVSIPLVAIILGLLDGFNPCAMWILLFLISMLFNMKDKKKMWLLGITFLTTSALVYFLAMLGLNIILSITAIKWIRAVIGIVALAGGIININSYIQTKNNGCHIVDDKKRNKYFTKIKEFTSNKSLLLSLFGVITLAISVNLVELACSAGFPTIFIELLNINNISFIKSIFYIFIYILFFLLDDLVVFIIAMTTLKLTGISTKYNRISHLVGGTIMILMGVLLILKPEWLMFNFN